MMLKKEKFSKMLNSVAKTNHTKIPILLFVINGLTSLIPVIQILLAYFVGATFYPFTIIDNETETKVLIIASIILSVLFLTLFYFSSKKTFILIFSILFIAYSNFGFMISTENNEKLENNYLIFYIILSIATTGTLLLTGKIKEKLNK